MSALTSTRILHKRPVLTSATGLLFLILLFACGVEETTPDVWTWMSGSDAPYQPGIYGARGLAHAWNVPGARLWAVSRICPGGEFWLFGGAGWDSAGYSGLLNDLWKYDPTYSMWKWVSGSSARNQPGHYGTMGLADPWNIPGARYGAMSWIDPSGKLWLFGGLGYTTAGNFGELNDLWMYDPLSEEWTWVSGNDTPLHAGVYGTKGMADPSNVPGAREGGVTWIDSSGELWLFGGFGYDSLGYDSSNLNDLWKFDPIALEWTWVSGSDISYQPGIYGTKGTPKASNVPGSRGGAAAWLDDDDKFWLFGGYGVDSTGQDGHLNDLWRFDPSTCEWTWISGSDIKDQEGYYGTRNAASPSNVPGARYWAVSELAPDGDLWLFGGHGFYAVGISGKLNDLWRFDRTTLQWTWFSGSSSGDQAGTYGMKGVVDPSAVPGGRGTAVSWMDPQGNFWIFGGSAYYSFGQDGPVNDLWRYKQ